MITIEKWAGLVTNASPYSIPPGAAVTQVNLQVINPGQLAVRPGAATVNFADPTGVTTPVTVAMRTPYGGSEKIVYQNSAGQIYVSSVSRSPKYPVRLLHAGGILLFNVSGTTYNVSPAYFWNGAADPDVMQILAGIGDLQELGVISYPNLSAFVSVQPSVDKFIADNPGAVLTYASLEVIMVDADDILFGWGTTSTTNVAGTTNGTAGVSMTISLSAFPTTTASWVVPNAGGGALAAMPIYTYLPLTAYQTIT